MTKRWTQRPPGSTWGDWGDDDELGRINLVTPEKVLQGVREVDRTLVDNARMLGANRSQLTRHVLFPSALTWILSSLHTSVGFALVGAVVGEYLAAAQGLGWVIAQAQGNFDAAGVYAGMVILGAVALAVETAVGWLERRLVRWKPPASSGLLAA